MIEGYVILAGRIRKELDEIDRLVVRANRAYATARKNPQDADLYMDSVLGLNFGKTAVRYMHI
jgi:hypothetical protein